MPRQKSSNLDDKGDFLNSETPVFHAALPHQAAPIKYVSKTSFILSMLLALSSGITVSLFFSTPLMMIAAALSAFVVSGATALFIQTVALYLAKLLWASDNVSETKDMGVRDKNQSQMVKEGAMELTELKRQLINVFAYYYLEIDRLAKDVRSRNGSTLGNRLGGLLGWGPQNLKVLDAKFESIKADLFGLYSAGNSNEVQNVFRALKRDILACFDILIEKFSGNMSEDMLSRFASDKQKCNKLQLNFQGGQPLLYGFDSFIPVRNILHPSQGKCVLVPLEEYSVISKDNERLRAEVQQLEGALERSKTELASVSELLGRMMTKLAQYLPEEDPFNIDKDSSNDDVGQYTALLQKIEAEESALRVEREKIRKREEAEEAKRREEQAKRREEQAKRREAKRREDEALYKEQEKKREQEHNLRMKEADEKSAANIEEMKRKWEASDREFIAIIARFLGNHVDPRYYDMERVPPPKNRLTITELTDDDPGIETPAIVPMHSRPLSPPSRPAMAQGYSSPLLRMPTIPIMVDAYIKRLEEKTGKDTSNARQLIIRRS